MRKVATLVALAAFGCTAPDEVRDKPAGADGKGDASAEATFLQFELDGELYSRSSWAGDKQLIQDQLLYTIGHLNGDRSVGRLDRLELTNIQKEPADGGLTKVRYRAKLPVAWGSKTNLPTEYAFTLPKDVSYEGLAAFTEKYKHDCVDWGAHDVDQGSMWYYYRPAQSRCRLAEADVVKTTAKVTVSPNNTTGKYPEYHKVWEDGALNVVAIFGKYEDGATTSSDAGVAAYNQFVRAMKSAAPGVTTTPAELPSGPGIAAPDITFVAELPGGKKLSLTALLVDNVRTADATFVQRYESLSSRADVIAYNGHAGLGDNVRALARRGKWVAGQYVIVFMNGCDTFAYVDGSLAEARARLNPDDPTGTRYMEFITNAMPAFFHEMPDASLSLVKGLLAYDRPLTYEQIFAGIDRSQVVLVTGEEDNEFRPAPVAPSDGWLGLDEKAGVTRDEELHWETPELPPGAYVFKIENDVEHPGGDADLYVRRGERPTRERYDCRPYLGGSVEECRVRLEERGKLHVAVIGYSRSTSYFRLTGAPDLSR